MWKEFCVSSPPLVTLIKVNFLVEVDKGDLHKWMKKMSWKLPFKSYLKNFFWFDWTKSIFLHQSWKKSVKRCIFSNSISLGIFADSRISLCHCHQTCLLTTGGDIFDWPTFFGHDCTWRSWWWWPIWEMTSDGLWSKPWRVQWQSFREYSRWSVRHGRSGRLQRSPWRPWPSCPQSFSVLDDWS